MIVYQDTKKQFQTDVDLNRIVDKIYDEYIPRFGHTTESQLRAWKNSMQYMHNVLNTNEIPDDAGVAIEYNIQPTSKRIDFLLSGKDENGNLTYQKLNVPERERDLADMICFVSLVP